MSTVAVRAQGNALSDKMAYAQAMASSTLLPKQYQRQPGNLLFALEYADALGVSPIHAITSIHVIEGKPTASADLIAALIRKAGHRLRITGDDTQCVAILIRLDDPDFEFRAEWTMKKAQSAGLTGKGVWKNYPGAMLRSRAITEVARMGAPDALYGVIYTPEELGADVNAEGEPVEFVEQPAPEPERPKVTRQRKPVEVVPEAAPEPEIIDAEPIPEVELITEPQMRMLFATLNDHGVPETESKAFLEAEIGHALTSRKNITKAEASTIIDRLTNEPAA